MSGLNYSDRRNLIPHWLPAIPMPSHKDAPTLEKAEQDLAEWKLQVAKGVLWLCVGNTSTGTGCGMVSRVSATEIIQTHWYTHPYSCSGGDYWNIGERQLVCPACGRRNRLYDSPEFAKVSSLAFRCITEEYDEH